LLASLITWKNPGSRLEQPGNETPGALHVFKVGLANRAYERLLLHADPIEMAGEYAREQSEQAGPVGHRQADPQHG
jgi:hypothetical protein